MRLKRRKQSSFRSFGEGIKSGKIKKSLETQIPSKNKIISKIAKNLMVCHRQMAWLKELKKVL
jgi:hypothetical protein